MPIAPGNYPIIEPNTPLGRALVEFFDVLVPVYGSGEKGLFVVGCGIRPLSWARI